MNNLELNKIYNESNLVTMSKMQDDFVDIVITSPPYNLGKGRAYKGGLDYDEYDDKKSIDKIKLLSKINSFMNTVVVRFISICNTSRVTGILFVNMFHFL